MKKINTIIILLALFFVPLCGHAESKPTVAVLWFENRSPDRTLDYLSNYIPDIVAVELSGAEWCIPVEREEVHKALDEIMLVKEGFAKEARVRRVEPADYLFSGHFSREGKDILIVFRLYDWKRGRIETKEFTTTLARIDTTAKDAAEYLKDKLFSAIPLSPLIFPVVETSDRKVIICFDVKRNIELYNDGYPFKAILLDEILGELALHGIHVQVIENMAAWNKTLKKPVKPSAHLHYLSFETPREPSSPFIATLFNFGTGDNLLTFDTAVREKFSSIHFMQVRTHILESILKGYRQNILTGRYASQMNESLVYYDNFLRQRFYHNHTGCLNEILKALYLYHDFSFYWYLLAQTYGNFSETNKEMTAWQEYLLSASSEKHPVLYEDALFIYITRLCGQNISSSNIRFAIPLLEKILSETPMTSYREKRFAVLLSRIYIFRGADATDYHILLNKKLISSTECSNALNWIFLFEKFGVSEKEKLASLAEMLRYPILDWEHCSDWKIGGPHTHLVNPIKDRYIGDMEKQKEFFSILYEAINLFPNTVTNCYLLSHGAENFDKDIAEATLTEIEGAFPFSLPAYYVKLQKTLNEFPDSIQDDRHKFAEDIITLTLDKLMSLFYLRLFLRNCIFEYKLDEDSLVSIFSMAFKKMSFSSKREIWLIVPEPLKSKIVNSEKMFIPVSTNISQDISCNMDKKKPPKILIGSRFKNIEHFFKDSGYDVGILQENPDENIFAHARLIICHLNDITIPSRQLLNTEMLNIITENLKDGVFILLVPFIPAQSVEAGGVSQLNEYLAKFNCYLDFKKRCSGSAVFLPGLFKDISDAHLQYHKALQISSGVSYKWDHFRISGYPVYSEKATTLIEDGQGYSVAVSFNLPRGGIFIVTGEVQPLFPFSVRETPFNQDFYEPFIYRNIWRLFLEKFLGIRKELTPIPVIRKLYDFCWSKNCLRLEEIGFRYVNPMERWIEEKPLLDENSTSRSIAIGEDILQNTDDTAIMTHCHIYLGLLYKGLGRIEESISHLQRAYTLADVSRDKIQIGIILLDTAIYEISTEDKYSCYSLLLEEVLHMLGTQYSKYAVDGISLLFYDLKGRHEEAAGHYLEALTAYRQMEYSLLSSHPITGKRLYSYLLFRMAEIHYKEGNYTEMENVFAKLLIFLSYEWSEQGLIAKAPNIYEYYCKQLYSTGFGSTPFYSPFVIKVASLLYLRDTARKSARKFLYAQELQDTVALAREWIHTSRDPEISLLIDVMEKTIKELQADNE